MEVERSDTRLQEVSSEPAIELRDLSREFVRADGTRVGALRNVNLRIHEGQFVCVIGPSGCGKTTLLSLIAGLAAPSAGEIRVHGRPVTKPGPDRGVVFQRDSVFPWMRVIDNAEYGLRCRGVAKAKRREIALEYLAAVGLGSVGRSWPRELSGGMLQRVAVATVFANGAEVLLLDEPFGSLDYVTRHQLHDVLLRLWQEEQALRRRVVIFVTHDVDEALTLADRIVVIREGALVDDVMITTSRPRTPDKLASSELLAIKHLLLGHLGLEQRASRGEAPMQEMV
jgi:NitT/TauT family transport system ATP-binding protein